jgi:intein-encoded DNA endonuclease-like protein
MKATREASLNQLVENGMKLANSALQHGTTTVEIKSGYGLSLDSEIRQLESYCCFEKNCSSKHCFHISLGLTISRPNMQITAMPM